MERVLAKSGDVRRKGKKVIVIADLEGVQPQKGVALGEFIQVQQELFRRTIGILPAATSGVLLAFLGACEIKIAPQAVRHGKVGLLNAPKHLLVKLLLKCLRGFQDGFSVGVLSLKISDNFGILFLAKPGVVVDSAVAMKDMLHGLASSYGRGWQ